MMRNVKWRIYKSGLKMTQIYIQDYIQNRLSFLVSRPYVFAKKKFLFIRDLEPKMVYVVENAFLLS